MSRQEGKFPERAGEQPERHRRPENVMIADKSSRGGAGITRAADISGTHTRIIFQFALLFLGSGLSQQAWPFKAAVESGEMDAHSSARLCLKWQQHKTRGCFWWAAEADGQASCPGHTPAGPAGLLKGPPYDSREEKAQHTHTHLQHVNRISVRYHVYIIQKCNILSNFDFSTWKDFESCWSDRRQENPLATSSDLTVMIFQKYWQKLLGNSLCMLTWSTWWGIVAHKHKREMTVIKG